MEVVALLRGVTPTGKNKIPKMAYLVEILENVGFQNVRSYIQSGNILLETTLSNNETAEKIHSTIKQKIGADLSIIIKTKKQLKKAIEANPFNQEYDKSRILLVFTTSNINPAKVKQVETTEFLGEVFYSGKECFYLYLPRDAEKKRLTNNYLEKHLNIVSTSRKLNVIQRLCEL